MIENNITQSELANPLNEHLMYINEVKNALIKAYEATEELCGYYAHNQSLYNQISRTLYRIEEADKNLNELFALE
ncbi:MULTISPECIES: hypothetical protein [Campylobacter]|uniref:Uncharacterized protein n=2 Tax=Campylobacter helveticus TaxID=28898 RepID=A0AAX2UJA1_9BACT|nr:hypothetical protein [Campylobacter helveticus]MDL0100971.1 hypothetical protein [Campylobacter felis]ARE80589.1 hypothetical protein CHELV3228_0999 [Campylobacter helveticus]MCR2039358.1 hypothetical protein [Campylobacter helveticus]MCR2056807.1 hypothetical protein [Campylobacter helveticus]MCR2062837.1 hypothetical protein [Campylobacter helveticus]